MLYSNLNYCIMKVVSTKGNDDRIWNDQKKKQ